MILKGSCDHLSWHSALDHRRALAHPARVCVPGAGHDLQHDRPAEVLDAIAAFLQDRPLPRAPLTGDGPPPGYRGPP